MTNTPGTFSVTETLFYPIFFRSWKSSRGDRSVYVSLCELFNLVNEFAVHFTKSNQSACGPIIKKLSPK